MVKNLIFLINIIYNLRYVYHNKIIRGDGKIQKLILGLSNKKSVLTKKLIKFELKHNQYKDDGNFYLFITDIKKEYDEYNNFIEKGDNENYEKIMKLNKLKKDSHFKLDLEKYIFNETKTLYIIFHSENVFKKSSNKFKIYHLYLEITFEFNYFIFIFYILIIFLLLIFLSVTIYYLNKLRNKYKIKLLLNKKIN